MPQPSCPQEALDSSIFFAVKKLNRALNKIAEDFFHKVDLKPSYVPILLILSHENGKIQKDLAKMLCIAAPSMTRLIEKLVHKDLVKVVCEGRTKRIYLTDKGREIIPELCQVHLALHEEINQLVKTGFSDTLIAELNQITNQLQ
ncbi:MarR family transcriptional regulator [Streptococcus sp. KCJ4932]|uniref:MarR family winged helix-turn-helix transcriptional regulator n=1 Tax=Streptococcus sp. KCJ4932 TaxID=2545465 RepID=UPI001055CCC6|nr:MarR family transcriptional regulator [Streptococcus sp. KCJ4932]TDE68902.1 MarR family transcriptional regulator [Streptococcus sp. KCJ4932]